MTSPDADKDALIADLRLAVAARDEFIAIAAHELRNPMTPMIGQVQRLLKIARREAAPPAVTAGLERLEEIVLHYVKRATTLLEISRISAGRLQIELETFDLSRVVKDCAETYGTLAARAGSSLEIVVQPDIEACLDQLAIEQITDNLLSNAVKYGDGTPLSLHLACTGDQVTLTVRDRGIGISPDDLARVFDRFEQAVGQRSHGGFGIGLWVVRQLVEAMKGTIRVESRLAEGSTFTVCLPRRADTACGESR